MKYLVFDDMTECGESAVQQLLEQVPACRREQAMRFSHTFGRFCCLKAWQMLQQLAPSSFQISDFRSQQSEVRYNPHGKPWIAGGPEFSISHCKCAIAVAVNDTPIGIDVEAIRAVDESLVKRTMNEEEQRQIAASADTNRAFIRLWTMKEAYLKQIGTGIVDDLQGCLQEADRARFTTIDYGKFIMSVYKS